MSTCSIVPIASGLHDADVVSSLVASLQPTLSSVGGTLVASVEEACTSRPMAVLIVTGGTERSVLSSWAARQQFLPGEPLLLLTHREQNSLPAALETLARLERDGATGRIIMLGTDSTDAELVQAVRDLNVWHRLRRARVGLLGAPSDWLVASVPDRDAVHRRWGLTIVDADLDEALDRFDENIEAPIAVPVHVGARRREGEPHPAEVETAARFEPVLRDVVLDQHLDAIAVRCFDLLGRAYTSGCVALSALNDAGVVAGCEGDAASTVGMLWARAMTGEAAWMANPAAADRNTGRIELAHCTVPLSMVDSYELTTHFESGIGVGIAGTFRRGPVTLLRLGGLALEHLWCHDGEAVVTEPREGRCRTQLDVVVDGAAVGELLDHPLGNHLVMIRGHHAAELRRWFDTMLTRA